MPVVLAINPNTTTSITDLVAGHLRRCVPADITIVPATGRFGARYISAEASYAVAGHAALECYAEHAQGTDAVLLACFGDPGLFAMREACDVPVVGLAEASMREAAAGGRRFAIVTGGRRWAPMLERLAASLGFADALAAIRTVALTGVQIAADPDAAIDALAEECRRARTDNAADAVILGGAGLAGLAVRVMQRIEAPVIDSVEAGARAAVQLARGAAPAYARIAPGAVTPSVGLSAHLAPWLRD